MKNSISTPLFMLRAYDIESLAPQAPSGFKETLAIANGDMDHDNRDNMNQEKALKNWLRKTSMNGILQWFDAIQRTDVDGKHWKTEMSKRDRLFLDKLGVKLRG
jgi:hypothetical protein